MQCSEKITICNLPFELQEVLFSYLSLTEQSNYAMVNKEFYHNWKAYIQRKIKYHSINLYFVSLFEFLSHPLIPRLKIKGLVTFPIINIRLTLEGFWYHTGSEYYLDRQYCLWISSMDNIYKIQSNGYFKNNVLSGLRSLLETRENDISNLHYNIFLDDKVIGLTFRTDTILYIEVIGDHKLAEFYEFQGSISEFLKVYSTLVYPSFSDCVLNFVNVLKNDVTFRFKGHLSLIGNYLRRYSTKAGVVDIKINSITGVLIDLKTNREPIGIDDYKTLIAKIRELEY